MAAGRALGKSIAAHGLRLVYGGGTKGIMGAVAAGVIDNGGQVTGIIPEFLVRSEVHTSELQSLMPISYALFCFLKKFYFFIIFFINNYFLLYYLFLSLSYSYL